MVIGARRSLVGRSTRAHRVRAWIPKTGGGSSSSEQMQLEASSGCKKCGSNATESLCNLQWCADCRNKLADRNFSTWATVTFGLVVVLLLVALTQFSSSLKAGIAFARGPGVSRRLFEGGNRVSNSNRAIPRFYACTGEIGDRFLSIQTIPRSRSCVRKN